MLLLSCLEYMNTEVASYLGDVNSILNYFPTGFSQDCGKRPSSIAGLRMKGVRSRLSLKTANPHFKGTHTEHCSRGVANSIPVKKFVANSPNFREEGITYTIARTPSLIEVISVLTSNA